MPTLSRVYPRAMMRVGRATPATRLPPLRIAVASAQIDAAHLARYAAVCGFPNKDVPVTYPIVFTFPLLLAMLGAREWPLGLPGLIHLGVSMSRTAVLAPGRAYRASCAVGTFTHTALGLEFELLASLHAQGERVWHGCSRVLARTGDPARRANPQRAHERPGEFVAEFPATTTLARSYAAASGDWNPIHLGVLGARLFGFARPVAHGMWTLARSLAVLGAGSAAHVDADFTAPLRLPGTARVVRGPDGAFAAADARSGRTVLRGLQREGIFPG